MNSPTFKLPPRVDGKPQVSPPGELDQELVTLYMDEFRQSRRIVEGCLAFGEEPPTRDQSDGGLSFRFTKMLDATAPLDQLGEAESDKS